MSEKLSEQYRLAAKSWVDLDSAARMSEECKSAFLSQRMLELGDMPVSRAEMEVKGSEVWKGYLESMVQARTEANLARVKLRWIEMRFQEAMSEQATQRSEMRL